MTAFERVALNIRASGIAVVLVACFAGMVTPVHALTVGSETVVSAQGSVVFPSGANDVIGFTRMKSGFTLQDAATIVRWSAYFPISGNILLNGGLIVLNQDMVLYPGSRFLGTGKIDANGYSIILNDDGAFLNSNIVFTNNATINGQGHVVDLSNSRIAVSGSNKTVTLRNLTITGMQNNDMDVTDAYSAIRLQDCSVNLKGDFSVTTGTFEVRGTVNFAGTNRCRVAGGTFRISTNAACIFGSGTSLDYAGGSIQFDDVSSQLQLQSAALLAEENLSLTRGALICDGAVTITASAGKTLTYGNGTNQYNLSIQHGPGARVHVSGNVVNANVP